MTFTHEPSGKMADVDSPIRLQAFDGVSWVSAQIPDVTAMRLPNGRARPLNILSLDLSKKSSGWAYTEGFHARQARSGVIDFTDGVDASWDIVYTRFSYWLDSFLRSAYRPDVVAFEQMIGGGHKSFSTAHRHGGWEAVALVACRSNKIGTCGISPTKVKKIATGRGNANKKDVADALRPMYRFPQDAVEDLSDAFAIGHAARSVLEAGWDTYQEKDR